MNWEEKIKVVRKLPLIGLLITIFASSLLLIALNFYTLKTMSSVRAYINGESNYSKGEKDATQSLISYILTNDTKYWNDFMHGIMIPQGDSIARVGLLYGEDEDVVRKGFLQGDNHEQDVDDMIWLFRTFKNLPLMAGPIVIWEKGDSLISQKYTIAIQIKASVDTGTIDSNRLMFLNELKRNSDALTNKEKEFSESLGAVARKIRDILFYTNTVIILVILGVVSFYAITMLRRLKAHNNELAHANEELDRIANSISHDLRAPINSMMGLVNLAKGEKNNEKLEAYLDMIQRTLNQQERFIKEMIVLSRENKKVLKKEMVNLDYLVEQVVNLHKHMSGAEGIRFSMLVNVHAVFTDAHRLEIILNNLVSNAIKYHDQSKSQKVIEISTYSENDKIHINVIDNGIGIDGNDVSRIFEMYYMSKDREKGSGLGLHIVKEAITKLGGEIKVKSIKGEGSTFTVLLNK